MSIVAAAIAFPKEMKLSIGGRCQATANESGVKPPHSKVTHGCNLQTDACRTHSLCAAAKRVHPTICLAINLIIVGVILEKTSRILPNRIDRRGNARERPPKE